MIIISTHTFNCLKRSNDMKKVIIRYLYGFFFTASAITCLFLICDGISSLFCGHFRLFVKLNYSLPVYSFDEFVSSLELYSDLYTWYTPIFDFLHKASFFANLAFLFIFFTKYEKPKNIHWQYHLVFFLITLLFLCL